MKLKKFFAGVLAAAMMLTVGATAVFATAGTDEAATRPATTIPATTPLGIMKNYKVLKGTSPAVDFSFNVAYKADKSQPYSNSYTFTDKSYLVHFESVAATDTNAVSAKDLGIKIEDFNLPAGPGKYVFEIAENIPQDSEKVLGVGYDNTKRYLSITVANDATMNGQFVYYAQLYSEYADGATLGAVDKKVEGKNAFTNTYGKAQDGSDLVHNVVINKQIAGNFSDLSKSFNFTIKLSPAKGMKNDYVGAKVISYEGATKDVEGKIWAIDGSTEHSISLGRNQSIELENLPEGVIVTVVETDGTEYDVTKSSEAVKGYAPIGTLNNNSSVTATVANANGSIGFINTKVGTPDMGVVLDNAPYIAMLAIVAIGGMALMLNKRRRDEE